MSLPAIPVASHVLPAIPIHSHVTTSHPHALSCHYQPSPCTLMSLPAIPVTCHYQPSPYTLIHPCIAHPRARELVSRHESRHGDVVVTDSAQLV